MPIRAIRMRSFSCALKDFSPAFCSFLALADCSSLSASAALA
jgi:hypothetical protein